MKNAMKKLLSLMLVAVLLVSAVPFKAAAATDNWVDVILVNDGRDTGFAANEYIRIFVEEDGKLPAEDIQTVKTAVAGQDIIGWSRTRGAASGEQLEDMTFTHTGGINVFPVYSAAEPATTDPATEPTTAPTTPATEPAPTTPATEPAPTTPATEPAPTTPPATEPAPTTPPATEPAPTTPPATEPADDNADLVIGNGDKKILLTLDMNYEGSKDRYVRVTDPNTKMGVIMEAIQKHNLIPTRANYTFAGWYWDDDFDYKVKDNEYLTDSKTTAVRIYARWTRTSSANNVYLKIYLNGTTSSPAKIVDISSYGDADGTIDIYEARKVVGNYYTAKDSAGLSYDGLFTDETWKRGAYNDSDEVNSVPVNEDEDTFIYIMVYNAKTASSSSSSSGSSSSNADTTNPKTGDSVYMVMTVMGLSAAALAAVYYVSKKRAF